jgi:uncharacterized membrane protein YeaQ/YmgE (transglycosylase-associated protein family)
LLAGSFLGVSLGWLHTKAQGQGALCFCCVGVVGKVLGSVRKEYLPFLVHIQDRFRAMSYGNEHETSYLRTYAC